MFFVREVKLDDKHDNYGSSDDETGVGPTRREGDDGGLSGEPRKENLE
jgi:hypothetical protein